MVPSDSLTDPLADPLTGWRARLRAVPVFDDDLPGFEVASAPEDPLVLVAEWLDHAIESGRSIQQRRSSCTGRSSGGRSGSRGLSRPALWPVSRAHTRLLYLRAGGGAWSHGMLAE